MAKQEKKMDYIIKIKEVTKKGIKNSDMTLGGGKRLWVKFSPIRARVNKMSTCEKLKHSNVNRMIRQAAD